MQVIGAGLPRTGTASTKSALETLLNGKCYHMKTLVDSEEPMIAWHNWLVGGGQLDLKELTKGYDACVDSPLCFLYKELMELYPDAKVVLNVREADRWFSSWNGLMKMVERLRLMRFLNKRIKLFLEFLDPMRAKYNLVGSEADHIAEFERHNAEVQAHVPADRLLVFDVRDGWEPLCEFLDVPVPDEPFPNLNSGPSMLWKGFSDLVRGKDVRDFHSNV